MRANVTRVRLTSAEQIYNIYDTRSSVHSSNDRGGGGIMLLGRRRTAISLRGNVGVPRASIKTRIISRARARVFFIYLFLLLFSSSSRFSYRRRRQQGRRPYSSVRRRLCKRLPLTDESRRRAPNRVTARRRRFINSGR